MTSLQSRDRWVTHPGQRGTIPRMNKKYQVSLTENERAALAHQLSAGTAPAGDLTHARILLESRQWAARPGVDG